MLAALQSIPGFFLRPVQLVRGYRRADLLPDLLAGLTVGVVLLPQALVFALAAQLPPEMGLYAAIVAAIVGALWGSSHHLQTGPTNTASALVLSALLPHVTPGTSSFVLAAGVLAVMAGLFRVALGVARLGFLVNFVSDSVVIGFTSAVGVLIAAGELRSLLRLTVPSGGSLADMITNLAPNLPGAHLPSLALGLGTIALIMVLQRVNRKLPGPLIAVMAASVLTAIVGPERLGVRVLGQLPAHLPPLAPLPLFDLELIGHLSTGALAVGAIGLVEASSIARSIAAQSGQRLDSNQEFIGQGLANIAAGFFSGYPCSGSFNRSAQNYQSGARTPLASAFSGIFVLLAMFVVAPMAAFVPRAALAGMLILTAYNMIDRRAIARIWRGARGDAVIMSITLGATLLLPLPFAVLSGIIMSLAYYIMKTSTPRVISVVPDDQFRHLIHRPDKPVCPQLGIIEILGDLYFGAANHIEEAILRNLAAHPSQRFLLLRMQSVDYCDISGIYMLEGVLRTYRERGGDLYLMQVRAPVLKLMRSTGFIDLLGADHLLAKDNAIEHLFYHVLDPAICIYESNTRVFRECQNLPRPDYTITIPLQPSAPQVVVPTVAPRQLWQQLRNATPPLVVDVREPREFRQGHIPLSCSMPLATILNGDASLPRDEPIVLVCRSGRRSQRAAQTLVQRGFTQVMILEGGLLAWEAAGLLEAVGDPADDGR